MHSRRVVCVHQACDLGEANFLPSPRHPDFRCVQLGQDPSQARPNSPRARTQRGRGITRRRVQGMR